MAGLLLRVSVLLGLTSICLGIAMGVREDFTLAPSHAHLNLLGFIMLFMSGLYYRVVAAAAAHRLARVQGWASILGAVLYPVGLGFFLQGFSGFQPVMVGGSILVVLGMILFALIVFQTSALDH